MLGVLCRGTIRLTRGAGHAPHYSHLVRQLFDETPIGCIALRERCYAKTSDIIGLWLVVHPVRDTACPLRAL